MLLGFEVVAAKPKGNRAPEDQQPRQESMRGSRRITSKPSSDQKKDRRRIQRAAAKCPVCSGSGKRDDWGKLPCARCAGSGSVPGVDCPTCAGTGHVGVGDCQDCGGRGYHIPGQGKAARRCPQCAAAIQLTAMDGWAHGDGSIGCWDASGQSANGAMRAHALGLPRIATQRMAELEKLATEFDANADRLNPGDTVRGPNGNLFKILRVDNHKTDGGRVVVHTEGGAMIVPRSQSFRVVRDNNRQQELPQDLGRPGGNFNHLPGGTSFAESPVGAGSLTGPRKCPNCGQPMHIRGSGNMVCPNCGYVTFVGDAGAGGGQFATDSNQALISRPMQSQPGQGGAYNKVIGSAISQRAKAVLELEEIS